MFHIAQSLLPEIFWKKFHLVPKLCLFEASGCWIFLRKIWPCWSSVQHRCCQDGEKHWCGGQMTKQDVGETKHCLRSLCFLWPGTTTGWNDTLWCICPKTKFSGTCVAMMCAALNFVRFKTGQIRQPWHQSPMWQFWRRWELRMEYLRRWAQSSRCQLHWWRRAKNARKKRRRVKKDLEDDWGEP